MGSSSEGELLELIHFENSKNGNGTKMKLNQASLDKVISSTENRPLSVLIINGSMCPEKSFLLNYILITLKALEENDKDWRASDKTEALERIKSKFEIKAESKGVGIWSRAFLLDGIDDEIAVVVLNANDMSERGQDVSPATLLSLLCSSVNILNFSGDIQNDFFKEFSIFINFAQFCLEQDENSKNELPFQKMSFVIQNWGDSSKHPFGLEGGGEYFKEKLQLLRENATGKAGKNMKIICGAFEKCSGSVDCCLLPKMGHGPNSEFVKTMMTFIEETITVKGLQIKKIVGVETTPDKFKHFLEAYLNMLNKWSEEGDELTAEVMWDLTGNVLHENVVRKCISCFEQYFEKQLKGKMWLPKENLDEVLGQSRRQAERLFRSSKKLDEFKKEYEEKLERKITELIKNIGENQEKNYLNFVAEMTDKYRKNFKHELGSKLPFVNQNGEIILYDNEFMKAEAEKIAKSNTKQFTLNFPNEENEKTTKSFEDAIRPIKESVLVQNKKNRVKAEKTMEIGVQGISEEYKNELNAFIEECPHADVPFLLYVNKNILKEAKAKFVQLSDFGNVEFKREFELRLNKLIDEVYDTISKNQTTKTEEQKRNLDETKAQLILKDCLLEYISKMVWVMMGLLVTEAEREKDHIKAKEEMLQEFDVKCGIDMNTTLKDETRKKLMLQADKKFSKMKLMFKTRRAEEEDKPKVEKTCNIAKAEYIGEMETYYESEEFIKSSVLLQSHKNICQKIISELEMPNVTDMTKLHQQITKSLDKLFNEFYKPRNYMKHKIVSETAVFAIYFGGSYCCGAVYYNGKRQYAYPSGSGWFLPTYVSFNDDGSQTIGQSAKDNADGNRENTIYDLHRIIGRRMDDSQLQNDMRTWPFKLVDENGLPKLSVRGKLYSPEEILAKIFAEYRVSDTNLVKRIKCDKVVISVPHNFTDAQRQAVISAAQLAGFEVLGIISELKALALYYVEDLFLERSRNIGKCGSITTLVIKNTRRAFEAALMQVEPGDMEVLGTVGDSNLGGDEFTKKLVEHCVREFQSKEGIDLGEGPDWMPRIQKENTEGIGRLRRLRDECDRCKLELSSKTSFVVSVKAIANGKDLSVEITRLKFEEMNAEHFDKMVSIVDQLLQTTGVRKEGIEVVVFFEESTNNPKVQEIIKNYIGGSPRVYADDGYDISWGVLTEAAMIRGNQLSHKIDFA